MKEKVASLETQIALMQSDIELIKNKEPELPNWLKNSAIIMLIAMVSQIMTSVWWASSITTSMANLQDEVHLNTDFRNEFPKLHGEIMVKLERIEVQNESTQEKLKDIKSKLKFVDIKQQHLKTVK